MHEWQHSWKPIEAESLEGGQGVIVKVVNRTDGRLGALKQLHSESAASNERRYRMQQEANALIALAGRGVPKVLETNVELWNDKSQPMYIVMEWIEGPTLAQHISGRPITLDDSLLICNSLLETVGRCHALGIYHRDLKPDNIILRDGAANEPILVDFGMSWTESEDNTDREFQTHLGQEIGNRFLRLPEHVPGRHLHDGRSDLTVVVGLLFYTLTGEAPRSLRDVRGAMPHEVSASRFTEQTTQDSRWPRLRRIFNVGFQEDIDLRFALVDDLLARLSDLNPGPGTNAENEVQEELARLRELLNSERARQLSTARNVLTQANVKYLADHNKLIQSSGFVSGGSGPSLVEAGRASVITFFIVQQGASEPTAQFTHRVEIVEKQYVASTSVERGAITPYYRGTASDTEALFEAVAAQVPVVLAALLRVMHDKLQPHC